MQVSRLTLGRIAIGWFVFLLGAALLLPPLDSHASAQPTVKVAFAVIGTLFVIGTLVALMSYFMQAWKRLGTVPNRTAYMVWVGLETFAALFVLFGLAYSTVIFAGTRFR
jgi:hypothetical protein